MTLCEISCEGAMNWKNIGKTVCVRDGRMAEGRVVRKIFTSVYV